MKDRWQMNYNRSARLPPDIIKDAASYVVECFLLLLFVALLGVVILAMGWGVDD